MNICFFSIVTYWHGMRGGMDLYGKQLLEGLSKRGHNINVISTRHPEGRAIEEIDGITIYYLDKTEFGSSRKGWKKESTKKFKEILKEQRPDIVVSQHTAGFGIVKTAKSMGIPLVTIMHGYAAMIFFSVLNQVKNFKKGYICLFKELLSAVYHYLLLETSVLKYSSSIIAVSESVERALQKRPFCRKNKIRVIYPGINLDLFRISEKERTEKRTKLNISDKEEVILFFSLISKQKGTDIALKAFQILSEFKNIKLLIAGDGEYLPEAKSLAGKLGIEQNVIFTGFVPNETASSYYNAADIFIFPTLRFESFGIVIAEAMVCGKPVIASHIGSIPFLIDDGVNGLLVPQGNAEALADKIRLLLNDKGLANKLAFHAREKAVNSFNFELMIDNISRVLEESIPTEQK